MLSSVLVFSAKMTAFFLAALTAAAAASAPEEAAGESVFPLAEVVSGMRGTGQTTFGGTRVETFDVEVLGVLRSGGPKRNLIVARVGGAAALEKGGVYAGMSGSPVYVDGRFMGAVALTWSFSKDAIAGITPAEEMVALYERSVPALPALPSEASRVYSLQDFFERRPLTLRDALQSLARPAALAGGDAFEALRVPLVCTGFDGRFMGEMAPAWSAAGFMPVQGAQAPAERRKSAPPLVPGSPVGVQLMRGDMEIAASGTLTHVSGDRVLAFGHAFLGLGATPMPLVASSVETLIPRSQISFRMASTLETVGAVVRDSEVGVVGLLRHEAPMVPVRLAVTVPEGTTERFSYEVIAHPLFTPALAGVGVAGALSSLEHAAGPQTFEMDGAIALRGYPAVRVRDLVASEEGAREAAFLLSAYLGVLFNSGLEAPVVESVDVALKVEGRMRSAFLTGARVPRTKVRAGETLRVEAELRPYQEPARTLAIEVAVPAYLKGRSVSLFVSDSMTLTRLEAPRAHYFPSDFEELIHVLNGLRDNRHLYVHLVEWKPSYAVRGRVLPNLPSDVRALHRSPAHPGGSREIPVTYLTSLAVATDYHVRGFFQIPLEIQ